MITIFQRIVFGIASFFVMIYGIFAGTSTFGETVTEYRHRVESVKFYENTIETAYPQTDVANIIENHFNNPVQGKTKKCIVIGLDGCRADALTFVENGKPSGIRTLINDGGKGYLTYCGGVNYPKINTQDTSTAPGWCSILTGKWANVTGIYENGVVKSTEHLTVLTSLVESKKTDNSAFYAVWSGHFTDDDSTYRAEVKYCKDNNLDVNFVKADTDEKSLENILADLRKNDCTDFIFSIFECTDHAGHNLGFSLKNKEYENAFYDGDFYAESIINTIKSRSTYFQEDWLIIVTTDHGGIPNYHGNFNIHERITFIISNKAVY